MSNRNLVFVGGVVPESKFPEIIRKGSAVDYAANKYQLSLIEGLSGCYDQITVLSAPLISSYPKCKTLDLRSEVIQYLPNVKIIITGYINIPVVKLFSKCVRMRRALKKISKDSDLIIYSPHSPFLVAAYPFLKSHKNGLIIPDLPEFMTKKTNRLYLWAKEIDHKIIDKCEKRIQSFVLFSSFMSERVMIGSRPTMVSEGIYKVSDQDEIIKPKAKDDTTKTILYTGRADERYGIRLLLDAFALIPNGNYKLLIRGDGDVIPEVLARSEKDYRIQYVEKLSSKELKELQRSSTVLINPVSSKEEFTKYFFPSKTMEYLASGTPTIMSRLLCMPKEYEPFVFYYDDDTPEAISKKIVEVCEMSVSERCEYGAKARQFIIEEKNANIQAAKIKEFMNKL